MRTDSTTSKVTAALKATETKAPKAPTSTGGEKGDVPTAASPAASTDTSYEKAPAAHVAPTATVSKAAHGGHGDADPAPDHPGTPGATSGTTAASTGSTSGSSAWQQGGWQQKFSDLLGNDDAVGVLRDANLDEATYEQYFTELQQELQTGHTGDLDSSDTTGGGGSDIQAANAVSGDASTAATTPSGPDGFDDTQKTKFGKLFDLMGTPKDEAAQALTSLKGASSDQLDKVYTQLSGSLGSWNQSWKDKFQKAFSDAKVPAATQAQYYAALSGNKNDDTKLQAALDAVQPGWNLKTRQMFTDMGLPPEVMKDLQDKNWSIAQYQQAAKGMESSREKFIGDGRMKKLDDAKATEADKWGVVLNDLSGVKLDEQVAAIQKSHEHVSIWQRIGSAALNLIPGVGLVEYAVGKDFATGEKIDRSNPFNIGMAVLSAIPIATVARSGIAAIKTGATIAVDVAAETAATTAAREGATVLADGSKVASSLAEAGAAGRTIAVDSKGVATVLEGTAGAADAAKGSSLLAKLAVAEDASGAKFSTETANALATGGKEAGAVSSRVLKTADYYKGVSALTKDGSTTLATLRKVRAFVPGLRSVGAGGEAFKTASGLAAAETFNTQLAARLGKLSAEELNGLAKVSLNGDKILAENGTKLLTDAQAASIKTATGLDAETLSRVSKQAQQLGRGEGVVAQGSGKVWNFNPTKNNATVAVEDAGSSKGLGVVKDYAKGSRGLEDADVLRLGSTANQEYKLGGLTNLGSDAGFAQTAGALDARALSEAGQVTTAQARTAAIGADMGIGRTGAARLRNGFLPDSSSSVQGAIDAERGAGATGGRAFLGAVGSKAASAGRFGVGMTGLAGSQFLISGMGASAYATYQQQSDFADREQAEYEMQQRIATGQVADPASGLKIDPKTGLEVDEANGVAIDPTTGTRYDLQTGEVVGDGAAATAATATTEGPADATAATDDGATAGAVPATSDADDSTDGTDGTDQQQLDDTQAAAQPTGEQGDVTANQQDDAATDQQLVAAGEYE